MTRIALCAAIGIACIAAACRGNGTTPNDDCLDFDTTQLREADLLLRYGQGVTSATVLHLQGIEGGYSHVGIATWHRGSWQVVHAVPGENDKTQRDTVKIDPVMVYFSTSRAQRGAIARHKCLDDDKARAITQEALRLHDMGTEFDDEYDWNDHSKLYCTELVDVCFRKAGIDLGIHHGKTVNYNSLQRAVVFPAQLLENNDIDLICSFEE